MIEFNSRVLVIGDVMLDRFLSGEVQRISPEAPVPIVKLSKETASPGGAGHVSASLIALRVHPTLPDWRRFCRRTLASDAEKMRCHANRDT